MFISCGFFVVKNPRDLLKGDFRMQKHYQKVKAILGGILVANLMVAVIKLVVGSMIQSASLIADGYHSLSDGSSNIVGLIGVGLASKPVDEDHPYGHHKFETLSSLFISAMLFFIAGKILMDAAGSLMDPKMPEVTLSSVFALVFTLGVNIAISTYEYKMGKKLNSYVLMSDALHTRSDIFISSGVLLGLMAISLGMPAIVDPIISIVISGFIVKAGIEIFTQTVGVLTDRATVDPLEVEKIVMNLEYVKGVHKIRSRGSQSRIFVELHVLVNPEINVVAAHHLSHEIQDQLRELIQPELEANVHIEPYEEKR